jgi:predicted metallopeptidase
MKYSKMPELQDIVVMLKNSEAFKNKLEHVNAERIAYASFSQKNSKAKAKIGPIPKRFAFLLEDFDYFLEINQEHWLASTEGERLYIILHELCHIPPEGFDKESKHYKRTVTHDLQDFAELVKEYGVELENVEKLVELTK